MRYVDRPVVRRHPAIGYGVAVVAVAVAVVLTTAFAAFLAPMRLFFLWVAVLLAAIYGGSAPGLVATALTAIAATFLVFAPVGSVVLHPEDLLRLALFVIFAAAISIGVGSRHHGEERAASLSRWLSTTLNSIGDAVIASDLHGEIVYINRVAEELIGIKRDEAMGQPLGDVLCLVREDDNARVPDPAARVLEIEMPVALENHVVLVRDDGTRVPIEDSAAPIRSTEGHLLGVVLVFHDVSARRSMERERQRVLEDLRYSEQRYRTLVEANPLPQAVWSASPDGHITWSDRWFEITGQRAEDIAKSGGMSVVHPDDASRTWERWKSALQTATRYEDEIRVFVRGSRYRWFAIRAEPVRTESGEIREWIGVVADIHARKHQEEVARFINRATDLLGASLDYEHTLRALAKLCVPELGDYCAIDVGGARGYERLVVEHADPDKVRLVFDVDRRFRRDPNDNPIQRAIESGKSQLLAEMPEHLLQQLAKDPEHLAILRELGPRSSMLVPMIARGRTLGTIAIVAAESGRRYNEEDLEVVEELARRAAMAVDNARLYREAESANRAKDEFLATLSHELRTPLTAIVGWATMLRDRELDATTAEMALETILRSARTQSELVDDLLDVSRAVTGKLSLHLDDVDLVTIASDVVNAAKPSADGRGIDLRFTADASRLPVRGDDRRLRQVVWNLVANSIKFTDRGGHVDVTVAAMHDKARIVVSDSGRGIAPDFMPYVWDAFRQADSSSSREHGGLGLGLAVVRRIVEMHGGHVSATSAGLGHGATFSVEIPIALAVEAAANARQAIGDGVLANHRLLIVDDDASTRSLLEILLRGHGGSVVAASNSEEAMKAAEQRTPDLVLTDIAMPGEDGFSLMSRLRARWKMPVIAISAAGVNSDDRERALAAGFSDYIRKPFEPQHLVSVIAAHLERK